MLCAVCFPMNYIAMLRNSVSDDISKSDSMIINTLFFNKQMIMIRLP